MKTETRKIIVVGVDGMDARLSKKYMDALNNLMYFKFYSFYKLRPNFDVCDFYEPYYSAYGPPTDFILTEIQEGYQYDDFKLFLRFFGNTFK